MLTCVRSNLFVISGDDKGRSHLTFDDVY
jgi:hypothetical protein